MSYIYFLTWMGITCLRCCLFGGVYTLWIGFGTLWSVLFTLRSICYLFFEWDRYEFWGVGLYELLLVACCGTECARLLCICGGLCLGKCLFRKCLCYMFDFFVNVSSACVWHPGWFFSWSCNTLTGFMRSLAIHVDSSFGVSKETWLCCG